MREAVQPDPTPPPPPIEAPRFHAATRVGKKKITVTVEPATHKRLKALAVEREVTIESLLGKAVEELIRDA
jgi:predicted DNA-binding ribbon-helix-helix protein